LAAGRPRRGTAHMTAGPAASLVTTPEIPQRQPLPLSASCAPGGLQVVAALQVLAAAMPPVPPVNVSGL
jgi:hypothetical protein